MHAVAEALWRLAYPEQCIACGQLLDLDARHFCATCRAALPWIGPHACPRCGEQVAPSAATAGGCASCRNHAFAFKRAVAPFRYEGLIRDLLLAFKLGRRPSLAYVLGDLLCDYLAEGGVSQAADIVVPVPLHWKRRLRRGFNQAGLMALEVSTRFGLPVAPYLVRRQRATRTQTSFSGLGRQSNVRDAFAIRGNGGVLGRFRHRLTGRVGLLGQRVLLLDDILTTGSTASECARVLREAGAREVVVATVAKAQ